jgi:aryl-alcohol dehydrogenase-like predicted oxidoreductase
VTEPLALRPLGRTGLMVSRLGLGLAAVGRPGYITLGRAHDLPRDRTPEALATRTAEICDAAWASGVRYFDVARSYGRAEEFLAHWLATRGIAAETVTVGSKWGYRYTAGWSVEAAVHEEKQLTLARFEEQLVESRSLLGAHLDLYQIHSATAVSGCLTDERLLVAMVEARRIGACRALGLSLTGTIAERALELALGARVDGEPVFDAIQATVNLLEPSLLPLLAAAHAEGLGVIAKEVHANGRLTETSRRAKRGNPAAKRSRLHGWTAIASGWRST